MYAKIKILLLKLVISVIPGDAESSQCNLLKKIKDCSS